MPVPTKIQDLTLSAGSNSPAGTESPPIIDDYFRAHAGLIRSFYALSSSSIAAAATVDVGSSDAENVSITGVANISSLGNGYAGCLRELYCVSTPTFVHSASLALPGSANITAAAGDIFVFRCFSTGNWALVARSSVSFTNAALLGTCTVNGVEIGFRAVPSVVRNVNYDFAPSDFGGCVVHDDTSSYTYTVNASGASTKDQVITVLNNTGTGTITITPGPGMTLYLAGTTTTGSRTVGVRGLATIYFISGTVAYVSGPGVT